MFLRPQRIDHRDGGGHTESTPEKPMTTALVETAGGARCTFSKKCVLFLVLLLQICFIYGFWLLQLDLNMNSTTSDGETQSQISVISTDTTASGSANHKKGVNFIRKAASALVEEFQQQANTANRQANEFSKEFIHNRLNVRTAKKSDNVEWWCFREGTAKVDNFELNENFSTNRAEEAHCKCAPEWHGKDCGQPEVIWRALMTTKSKFPLRNPSNSPAHRLFHLIEGNFFSLDLLELLIRAVVEVVDYFVIFLRKQNVNVQDFKALEHKMRDLVPNGRYSIYQGATNTTTSDVYKRFRRNCAQVLDSDLLLYTNDHTILARQSLRFLKYYATDVFYVRFRLKHTVYGFYWQHPERTYLTGIISSFQHLDDPLAGNKDPQRLLLRSAVMTEQSTTSKPLIIGDLNHASGWYCEYCQQASEIIAELHEDNSSWRRVQFPNGTRSRNVDVTYVEKLIAAGVHVDGQRQLVKLRRYADRYYAPQYAEHNSWKFGHLLVNLFETFGDDIDDDDMDNY